MPYRSPKYTARRYQYRRFFAQLRAAGLYRMYTQMSDGEKMRLFIAWQRSNSY